jgi:hypothetical protein
VAAIDLTSSIELSEWKVILKSKKQLVLLITGLVVLLITFALNFFTSTWVDTIATNSVGDLLLDVIPVFEINFLFFWAVLIFWLVAVAYHFYKPKQLAFILWGMAAFVVLRCFFISLTHIGPPESAINIPESLSWFNFSSDMFFSGHVGGPFFVALLVRNRLVKRVIIGYSIIMMVIVLMAHGHYSIDLFAAFFIAHSLSVLVKKTEKHFYSV